jgi:hypothetical protein
MDIARIFFDPPTQPLNARIIPLFTHVSSVKKLVERWNYQDTYRVPEDCDLSITQEQLIEAARRHDEAKPSTFRVTCNGRKFGYSFAGHRFKVQCDDLYTDLLIKMHHEFSVDGIAEAQARIRREVGGVQARNFPLDLYTLEMCDQVAAEVECYAMEGHADERVFMELHSRKRGDGSIEVEPYPFLQSPLALTIEFYDHEIPPGIFTGNNLLEKITDLFKAWQPSKSQEKKVMVDLCRP